MGAYGYFAKNQGGESMTKRLRQIDYFFLVVVISFAFDFGDVKYALAGVFALIYIIVSGRYSVRLCFDAVGRRYGLILSGFGILLIITFVLQVVNGFNSYVINEIIYFLTPIMFVWVYITRSNEKTIETTMDYIFIIFIVSFFTSSIDQLTFENIKNISFVESYSPFESEKAFAFLVLECFYLLRNKKKKAFLALILCVLNFKRISLIFSILFFLFASWIRQKKVISKKIVLLSTVFFVLAPIITCSVLNGDFNSWFDAKFGISLAEFTLSRSQRIELVLNSDEICYGLGSVTPYITDVMNKIHGSDLVNRNLHNDLVRIYLECGIIGSIVFTYVFMKAASFSRNVFVLMCYIFLECYFNPIFGAGTASLWIIVYLFMAYVGKGMKHEECDEMHDKGNVKIRINSKMNKIRLFREKRGESWNE